MKHALDMPQAIDYVCETCHTCTSLRQLPETLTKHTSENLPDTVGVTFAADVLRRCKQVILVFRETTKSYTSATIIPDEKKGALRDHLARLCVRL